MAAATARVVVLMPPEEKEAITEYARRAGISVGELIRRSVWEAIGDEELENELAGRRAEIEPLLDELEKRNAATLAAIDATIMNLDRILMELGKRETTHEPRRTDLRRPQDNDADPRPAARVE